MVKIKAGDKIKIISTNTTKKYYGENQTMRNMIGTTIIVESIDKEESSIHAKGFTWSPKDVSKIKPIQQPKGGIFNIDNLVIK